MKSDTYPLPRPRKSVIKAKSTTSLVTRRIGRILRVRKSAVHTVKLKLPRRRFRSFWLRHLDCGSCNGCELALAAILNPVYDAEGYGISVHASPRHADIIAATGIPTRGLVEAIHLTLDAMPRKRVLLIGDCAVDGGIFKDSYAVSTDLELLRPYVVGAVPGCPPLPEEIVLALAESAEEAK